MCGIYITYCADEFLSEYAARRFRKTRTAMIMMVVAIAIMRTTTTTITPIVVGKVEDCVLSSCPLTAGSLFTSILGLGIGR